MDKKREAKIKRQAMALDKVRWFKGLKILGDYEIVMGSNKIPCKRKKVAEGFDTDYPIEGLAYDIFTPHLEAACREFEKRLDELSETGE